VNNGTRYPVSILPIKADRKKEMGMHPTQKPIELLEYLLNTYSNENEVILDNCIGSGTTAVAAINTGRQFIGIERESEYVEIANKRIADALSAKGGN
jgi:site-specific DNA-methyltransferase (adenine-specific)